MGAAALAGAVPALPLLKLPECAGDAVGEEGAATLACALPALSRPGRSETGRGRGPAARCRGAKGASRPGVAGQGHGRRPYGPEGGASRPGAARAKGAPRPGVAGLGVGCKLCLNVEALV